MLRVIGGLFAASAAAPYLASFCLFLFRIASGDFDGIDEPLDFLKFLVIGTFGLGMFGVPVLLAAAILALVLNTSNLRLKRHAVIGGSGLGGLFLGLFFSGDWIWIGAGLLSGAICGWIYWRIALHRPAQPDRSVPRQEP